MAEPSLLKYNSLAIALILELHFLCRCNSCLPPARDHDEIDVKEENCGNCCEEAESFLFVAKLPGAAKGPNINKVLKDEAMSSSTT